MCKKTVADYPGLVAQWDWDKNGDLRPEDVSYGSKKKVWWKCSVADDHEWEAPPHSRTGRGGGCPCCRGLKVVPSNCLATTHPELAAQWHPTKNGKLTPNDVIAGSHTKIWWKCRIADDHEWEAVLKSRANQGHNCPCCDGKKVVSSNCLATTHPDIATQWHQTKNGELTPNDVVAGSNKKVWWICGKGHEWNATIWDRTSNGYGCPCCSGKKVCLDNCLATKYPDIADQWHPTKNDKLTPKDVVARSNKKVWWICGKGHEWEATVCHRTYSNSGCPICNESKGEKKIREYLIKNNIVFKPQYKFKKSKIL